ncbi:MAG: hypothetical protein HOB73_07745 [Planctomycetaceae bacterium]|jgi:hypothetical protein|nr:hypothetical protein [Planctomycetaceae bacterium]
MSNSEKRLGAIVLALGVISLSYWILTSYTAYLTELENTEDRLETTKGFLERDTKLAIQDRNKLTSLANRSLPRDQSSAQTTYKAWLFTLMEKEVGLQDVKITSDQIRTVGGIYDKHTFRVSCDGSLQQLTEFLYKFYAKESLHEVLTLSVKPKGYNFLGITAQIDAIAVTEDLERGSIKNITVSNQLEYGGLEEYLNLMTNRNIFGPENLEPRFSGDSRIAATVGQSKVVTLTRNPGTDEQLNQSVNFQIASESLPAGFIASIKDNRLTVQGDNVGQYKVRVSASDTGLPVKTVFREFTVNVEKRPERVAPPIRPMPPKFDVAQLAFFTSTVQINNHVEVWILRRDINEMVKLTIGDRVNIGDIVGTIRTISQKELLILTDSDDTLLVRAGQSLATAENITQAAERLLESTNP